MNCGLGKLPRSAICGKCGEKLNVVRYLEENCTFFYELACTKGDSDAKVIQAARPLRPGSMCPNCLVGVTKQVPILEKGMRLGCDSCPGVILFGYVVIRKAS